MSTVTCSGPTVQCPPSTVFATWLYPDAVAAARLARRLGVPLWLKVHGSDRFHLEDKYRRRLILEACDQAVGTICVCRSLADALIEAGASPDKIHVVSNGVDTALFRYRTKEEATAQLEGVQEEDNGDASRFTVPHSASASRTILYVGNLQPIKGVDVLLHALAQLLPGLPSPVPRPLSTVHCAPSPAYRLLVIGAGPMRRALERQAAALGVQAVVRFLGARPHEEVSLWMNYADCLVSPSRSEGMPNVVVEALASGLPVVATDVGASSELLSGEVTCRVVPPDSPQAIAGAIEAVLGMEGDRESMAIRHARRFSWRGSAKSMLELMRGGT